jgi:hypothetical protein
LKAGDKAKLDWVAADHEDGGIVVLVALAARYVTDGLLWMVAGFL